MKQEPHVAVIGSRNIADADPVIAVSDGVSKQTAHAADCTNQRGISVQLYIPPKKQE